MNQAVESANPALGVSQALRLTIVPVGIALNLAIGTVVSALKLPVYIDAVGTVIVTLLCGLRVGVVTGIGSNLISGLVANPVQPWFCGTQAAIAIYTHFAARAGGFRSLPRTLLTGVGLGAVSGTVSAPILAYLFGGITGSGSSVLTAYLLSTGETLLRSVFLSGLASEPLDKTLQCLLAVWLLRGVPASLKARFAGPLLAANRL